MKRNIVGEYTANGRVYGLYGMQQVIYCKQA